MGDDLRERIARAAAGGYMRVPIVALDGMYLGPPWLDVADAVPEPETEPETERVKLWDAIGRSLPDGLEIVGWQWSTETRDGLVTHDDGRWTRVHDAPTVEVLKDGDR